MAVGVTSRISLNFPISPADVVDDLPPLEEGDDGQPELDFSPQPDPCLSQATPSGPVSLTSRGSGQVAHAYKAPKLDGSTSLSSSDIVCDMPANTRRRSPRFLLTPPSSVLSDLDQPGDPSSQRSSASPPLAPVDEEFQSRVDKSLNLASVKSSEASASSSSGSDMDVTQLRDLRSACLTPSTSPEPELPPNEEHDTPGTGPAREIPLVQRSTIRVHKKPVASGPVRRSTRNPEYLPLGPRHLEEEYHDAHQEFRHAVLQAVYSLGFDPKKVRDGRPVARSTPPTVEEIMSLRLPSVTIAKRRLDEADRRLNDALARGFTWENTKLPKYEVTYDDKGDLVSVVMVEDPLDTPVPPREVVAPLPKKPSKRKLDFVTEQEEPRRSKRQRP
ncbi:hypothetical protein BJ322DRAFT_1060596 [Thelephora terrestris]|uniref:Uncharacterized protein n=1 Tax=Thelephora terrestris TaxID=56493 RepID=A0A9P6HEA5_9AGAM|nr:hypothetical protein BJ322DRAFT_1060596 [Thelephora terrestris]